MNVRTAVRELPGYHFDASTAAVKLDQNESPDDLPADLRAAALERLRSAAWHRYPELHPDGLAARLGARHGWPADGVVVAGGSNVLIQALVVLSGLGRHVMTLVPTFSLYRLQARLLGAEHVAVPLEAGHRFPAAAVARELARGTGIAFLPTPLAPTGNAVAPADLRLVAEAAAPGWTVALDEAYAEFGDVDHGALASAHPRLVRLRTFSKALGLAGARVGYALAHPELARELRKALLPFSVSALQVAVAEAALDAPEVVDARVRGIVAERERLTEALRARGVRFVPSAANFLLLTVTDARSVHRLLLAQGVSVRCLHGQAGLDGALRVTVGAPTDNDAFLRAWDALPQATEVDHG